MIEVVSASGMDWRPYPGQRSMHTQYKPLFSGDHEASDNYEIWLVRYGTGGSTSPRHRHNFDQFRWAFDKPLNFGPGGDIRPGQLGYFPEGTYYGPQTNVEGTEMLILQFGGPGRSGYLPNVRLEQGGVELREKGEFKGGIYTTYRDGKKINQDGYEAVWEHVARRPIKYVAPRWNTPLVLNTPGFPWRPAPGADGVERRELGTFNEYGTGAFQLRLRAGTAWQLPPIPNTRLLFTLEGELQFGDRVGGSGSAARLPGGEPASLHASKDTVLIGFVMPYFED